MRHTAAFRVDQPLQWPLSGRNKFPLLAASRQTAPLYRLDAANHDTAALKAMLGPCRAELMEAYPVSPAINRLGRGAGLH